MTLHGLGMVGLWFVAGMAGVSFLLSRYVQPAVAVSWIAFGATLTGVVLLLAATLIGRLGVGWYFLYPLPFHSGGTWPAWATAALFAALAIMGVGWTLWAGDLLWAIARTYGLSQALGWQYLSGADHAGAAAHHPHLDGEPHLGARRPRRGRRHPRAGCRRAALDAASPTTRCSSRT